MRTNAIVVSSCACAPQGFPDSYVFSGKVKARYCQVGNAVAPPVGLALGRQLAQAVAAADRERRQLPEGEGKVAEQPPGVSVVEAVEAAAEAVEAT